MMKFNVIREDNGNFIGYDIMPYLIQEYNELKEKPQTFDNIKKFIKEKAHYQWWGRCEYEIILMDWPGQTKAKKIDIYEQISMNLDIITMIFIKNIEDANI